MLRRWSLGIWFVPLAIVVIVGSSNAVNLTDGLDGLAGGCLLFAAAAMTLVVYAAGHAQWAAYLNIPHIAGCGELAVLAAGDDRRRGRIPLVQLPSGPGLHGRYRLAAAGRIAGVHGRRRPAGVAAGARGRSLRGRGRRA